MRLTLMKGKAVFMTGLVTLTLVAGLTLFLFLQQNEQALEARDEAAQIQKSIDLIHIVSSKLKSAVLAHHRFLMTGDEKYLEEYKSFHSKKMNVESKVHHTFLNTSIEETLQTLQALVKEDPEQEKNIQNLSAELVAIWKPLDEIIKDYKAGKKSEGDALLHTYLETQVLPVRLLFAKALNRGAIYLEGKHIDKDQQASNRTNLVLSSIMVFFLLMAFLYVAAYRQWLLATEAEQLSNDQAIKLTEKNTELLAANDEMQALNKQIRESHEIQMQAVIDHALDGQVTMDSEGKILKYNDAFSKIFGFDQKEAIGKSITTLLTQPHANETAEHLKQHKENGICNGMKHRHESVARRKDGTIFPIDLSLSMFTLGQELFFSWFIRDITERKHAEAEIMRYTQELEQSNKDLDDFAYIASHDLKEPLRGLFNHAQFLLEDYEDKLDDDGKRRLKRLSFLAQRMEKLVNDLLYFSRIGRTEMAIQKTDPNEVVYDITHMIDGLLQESHAKVIVPAAMPTVTCDKPRFTEVLRNLITNAVKYNDKDEKVVEIGFLKTISAPHGLEKNAFYVKDNGIGIESRYYQDIFRIFKRLNPRGENDQSTGSGLTFVKKIVERHKGHVWVESEPGGGSTFYFNMNQGEEAA